MAAIPAWVLGGALGDECALTHVFRFVMVFPADVPIITVVPVAVAACSEGFLLKHVLVVRNSLARVDCLLSRGIPGFPCVGAGYEGLITPGLRASLDVTRYRSSKASLTYAQYASVVAAAADSVAAVATDPASPSAVVRA